MTCVYGWGIGATIPEAKAKARKSVPIITAKTDVLNSMQIEYEPETPPIELRRNLMVSLDIKEWHAPSNEDCPHNADAGQPCACKRPIKRKPYRRVRVNDRTAVGKCRSRLEVRVYPDGVMELREVGRRRIYRTTVFAVYYGRLVTEAYNAARAKKSARAERRN